MDRPETRYAVSGDVHVAYQVSGSGPIDMVWAPGTASQLDMDWDLVPKARFLRRIGKFCRLIRFDKRGTGLSDRVTAAATLEERTDDVRAVMDAAASEQAFLFGLSEGADLSCLFAATYPDRTERPDRLGRVGPDDTDSRLPVGCDLGGVGGRDRRPGEVRSDGNIHQRRTFGAASAGSRGTMA